MNEQVLYEYLTCEKALLKKECETVPRNQRLGCCLLVLPTDWAKTAFC